MTVTVEDDDEGDEQEEAGRKALKRR